MTPRLRRLYPFLTASAWLALVVALPWIIYFGAGKQKVVLRISGGQAGGVYQLMAKGLQDILIDPEIGLKVELSGSKGSQENMSRLARDQCDITLLQNGTPGNPSVRVIAPLYPEILHILVRADSEYTQVKQLRAARLAVGPSGSGTWQLVHKLFEHYGVKPSKMELVDMDMQPACQALLDGSVDAVILVAGLFAPALQKTIATGEARLLGLGEAGEIGGEAEGFSLHYPEARPWVIPRYTYRHTGGPEQGFPRQPVQTVAISSLLVCRAQLDEAVVHKITRALFEHRGTLARHHVAASQLREVALEDRFAYPLHPGAETWYRRNEPGFLVTYAEVLALILSLIVTLYAVLTAARKWILLGQKDRIDEYYVRLDELMRRMQGGTLSRAELEEIDAELRRMRHKALQQLVDEKLTANDSFRIFQTLLENSRKEVKELMGEELGARG